MTIFMQMTIANEIGITMASTVLQLHRYLMISMMAVETIDTSTISPTFVTTGNTNMIKFMMIVIH